MDEAFNFELDSDSDDDLQEEWGNVSLREVNGMAPEPTVITQSNPIHVHTARHNDDIEDWDAMAAAVPAPEPIVFNDRWMVHKAVMDRLPHVDKMSETLLEDLSVEHNDFKDSLMHSTPYLTLLQIGKWLNDNVEVFKDAPKRGKKNGHRIMFREIDTGGIIPTHDDATTTVHQKTGDILFAAIDHYFKQFVRAENFHALFKSEPDDIEDLLNLEWYLLSPVDRCGEHERLWSFIAAALNLRQEVRVPVEIIYERSIWYSTCRYRCHRYIQAVLGQLVGLSSDLTRIFSSEQSFVRFYKKYRHHINAIASLTANLAIIQKSLPTDSEDAMKLPEGSNIFLSMPVGHAKIEEMVALRHIRVNTLSRLMTKSGASDALRRVQKRRERRRMQVY